jgi:hypothetical protein
MFEPRTFAEYVSDAENKQLADTVRSVGNLSGESDDYEGTERDESILGRAPRSTGPLPRQHHQTRRKQ